MKKVFMAICALVITSATIAQKKADEFVKFKEEKYDFGKIKQGVPVTYDFAFTNISKDPVIIENAVASCGCTTPKWPQPPVMPGQSEKINVGYNAANLGVFEKTIMVKVQGIDLPKEIKIMGEVVSAEAFVAIEANKSKTAAIGQAPTGNNPTAVKKKSKRTKKA
jgi:Protein of unknown function (DUF1573)